MSPPDVSAAPFEPPRELVLASAGSGKTYHLSTRIIELLAAGAPPGEVLASTFTRKAAGEILDRVLLRLAEGAADPAKAEELGGTLTDPVRCRALLVRLVRELHHINVGTLDSFFIRIARSFSQEMELPPAWSITDTPTEDRLRTEAVQTVLAEADASELSELLHRVNQGSADRRVHDALLDMMDELLRIRRQVAPDATDPWSPDLGVSEVPPLPEIEGRAARLAERLRALEVPETKAGTPMKAWANARNEAAAAIFRLDWSTVFTKGIGAKVLAGEETFSRRPIPADFGSIFDEARGLARIHLAGRLRRACEGLGRLAELFEASLTEAQRRAGAYRFEDVTALLGGPHGIAGRPDLHYRLDQQVRHILLDEFQDTSFEQWHALAPLVDELLSGHLDERAGVIVADPKQSIYGWRGARPELVHQVGRRYGLERATLERSWRSSPVVLDFVARVFRDLPSARPIQELPGGPAVAAAWMEDFTELEAAKDLPGHVAVHVGPDDEGTASVQPNLLRFAAERIRDLHEEMPDRSIGVLVRTNKVLAHLMNELAALGVPAGGEGGAPLTDTAPVNALLSLLRLADHPKSSAALYHVARSPVGEVVGLTDPADRAAAPVLADRVRRRLVSDGYGPTLAAWVRGLAPRCDERETLRLLQLVELGHRWDARASLRPRDFVRYVVEEPVEDPSSAPVQVMTIHGAKGLEFDVVLLPELYASLAGHPKGPAVPERDPETGRITRVYPSLKKDMLPLFPEVERAVAELRAADLRDGLSLLYVALTRARHAMHLVIPPDGGSGKHGAGLVRSALALDDAAADADGRVWQSGDARWFEQVEGRTHDGVDEGDVEPAAGEPLLRSASHGAGRNLARRSPSALEGGEHVDLAFHLRIDSGSAVLRGSVVHAWCEAIGWIEDGIPDDDALRARARRVAPAMSRDDLAGLLRTFRSWMTHASVREALSRGAYPDGPDVTVRVERELPFVRRVGDEIQEGVIDRLVLVERDGRTVQAEVLDFKTDRIADGADPALDARVQHYRPQLEAYCAWVRESFALSPADVRGSLLFLEAGRVARAV
ncbi:MAG: UvrD-helicase domain-containing protein [Gemmatimonadota bacterium]|nr:UvrD-helicase domain-containing protein [Gemmatimonadota bacterium]